MSGTAADIRVLVLMPGVAEFFRHIVIAASNDPPDDLAHLLWRSGVDVVVFSELMSTIVECIELIDQQARQLEGSPARRQARPARMDGRRWPIGAQRPRASPY